MIKSGTILECTAFGSHGKPVVAVIGHIHDFAVYEQAYSSQTAPEDIAHSGDKVGEDEARELFPELSSLHYRR